MEHVYKVAKVKLTDGTFVNTMEHPLKDLGGIFSPELLTRLPDRTIDIIDSIGDMFRNEDLFRMMKLSVE